MGELFDYFDEDQLKSSCGGCTKAEEEVKFLLDHITNIFLENPSKFLGVELQGPKPYNSLDVFNQWAKNFDHDATHIKCSHLKEKIKYLVYKLLNKKTSRVTPLKRKFDDGLIDMLKSVKCAAIDVCDNRIGAHKKWKNMVVKARTALYIKLSEISDLEEFPFQKAKRIRNSPSVVKNEFNSPTLRSDLRRSQRTSVPTTGNLQPLTKRIKENSPTLPGDKVRKNEVSPTTMPSDTLRRSQRISSPVSKLEFPKKQKNPDNNVTSPTRLNDSKVRASQIKNTATPPSCKGKRSQRTLLPADNGGHLHHRVPVGPAFQADLPAWPYRPDPSEGSRWLGAQIWPAKGEERKMTVKVIGKGIQLSCKCDCKNRGSVSCIKKHVRKERLHFRSYLGPSFEEMGFDDMGEEVAKGWTEEEQEEFEEIVRSNPLYEGKSFLEPALDSFTWKSRRDIVSYYYNVFLLRKMSVLTRMGKADLFDSSDDDENAMDSD